jgi:putative FmdB family regulatory protein
MPTYEYRCRDCGEDLEVYQSFTDDALTVCPACGGSLRKLFGKVGISFKGTGFYKNDHGSRSSSTADSTGKSDSSSETKSTPSTETKSESKAETKTETKPSSSPAPSTA